MEIEYTHNDICFIWDEDKAEKNKLKHNGISFEQAANVFFDPFLKVVDASRNNEIREAVIGMDTHWKILYVVHIQIEDDEIRIISARKATKKEQDNYEN
jgi:uncharacterized DUF497 family protein